jgi:UDP-N-acetylmuramate--alanine ligase
MNFNQLQKLYFIGIGGIGMSALARYFNGLGKEIHGYDRVQTELTKQLEEEGMIIHYEEDLNAIPEGVDLVVYTPAIPAKHQELTYFRAENFPIMKRAEVLGLISKNRKTIGVAGTHGKTTTSAILTHVLRTAGVDVTAFLGGIARNLDSNFVAGESEWVVMEADEFDRSFLHLEPEIAIVTSTDADHLDIYGDHSEMQKTFLQYMQQVKSHVLINDGVELQPEGLQANSYRYGMDKSAEFYSHHIRAFAPNFVFNLVDQRAGSTEWDDLSFSLPGHHNVANAMAAIAVAKLLGCSEDKIRQALRTFKGIWRRFEWIYTGPDAVFIDDYAHHPAELQAAIRAARSLFPGRKLTGVFQPHLYSRTKDFADGFASSLEALDEVILLDIYPAREEPIEGVNSEMIAAKMKHPNVVVMQKNKLIDALKNREIDVLMTLGAGDIGALVPVIATTLFGVEKTS